jgi:hypothetical protein
MSLTAWSAFYDEVMPGLPGIETSIVDNALRNAAIELCTKSLIHKVTLDPFNTVIGTAEYDVSYDNSTVVAKINDGYVDTSTRIYPTTRDALLASNTVWETDTGGVTHFLHTDHATIRLYRIPDAVQTISLNVSLAPARTATGVEAFIYQRWLEGIASGALKRLCAIPGKPWSSPELATYHGGQFALAISDARIQATRDMTRDVLAVTPPII